MLQIAIDESEEDGVFVLGGYVADEANWAAFAEEWAAALVRFNSDRPFKMSLTNRRWRSLRGARVKQFYQIIAKHALLGVAVAVDPIALRKVARAIPDERWMDPYFFCMHRIIAEVSQHSLMLKDDLQFIFDTGRQKPDTLTSWPDFMEYAPDTVKGRIKGEPEFREDHIWLPLQAADMKAWFARKKYNELYRSGPPAPNWRSGGHQIQGNTSAYNEARLARMVDKWQGRPRFVFDQTGIRFTQHGSSFGILGLGQG